MGDVIDMDAARERLKPAKRFNPPGHVAEVVPFPWHAARIMADPDHATREPFAVDPSTLTIEWVNPETGEVIDLAAGVVDQDTPIPFKLVGPVADWGDKSITNEITGPVACSKTNVCDVCHKPIQPRSTVHKLKTPDGNTILVHPSCMRGSR